MAQVIIFTSSGFISIQPMNELVEREIFCPYCNEAITVLVDASVDSQDYIEDCQVCCRPIELSASINIEGELSLTVRHENE